MTKGGWKMYASTQIHGCKQCGGKGDDVGELDRGGDLGWGRVSCPWWQSKASLGGCLRELGPFTLVLEALTGQGIDTTHTAQAFYDSLNEAERQQLSRIWGWGSCVKQLWFMALVHLFLVWSPKQILYSVRISGSSSIKWNNPLSKYLLNICSVPGTILGPGVTRG